MTTWTVLFTLGHLILFFLSRRFYKTKAKNAIMAKVKLEQDIVALSTELQTYKSIVDGYEYDENE